MKVLIINQNSVLNLGDFAIYVETLKVVEAAFPQAEISLSFYDTDSAKKYLPKYEIVPSIDSLAFQIDESGTIIFTSLFDRMRYLFLIIVGVIFYHLLKRIIIIFQDSDKQRLFESFAMADLVLACGGGYLYETQKSRGIFAEIKSLLPWTVFLLGGHLLAIALNKPLILLPQSIGPFRESIYRFLVSLIVMRSEITFVREESSLSLIDQLGISQNVYYAPDLAFGMSTGSKSQAQLMLKQIGFDEADKSPRLGMTLLDWGAQSRSFTSQQAYERAIVACINAMTKQGWIIFLFSQCYNRFSAWDDREVNIRVRNQVIQPERVLLMHEIVHPELLQSMYGEMDYFIGTRMHSVILAINAGVPALAIGYLHKSHGIMQALGIGDLCYDIETITGEQLLQGLQQLQSERWPASVSLFVMHAQYFKRALAALLPYFVRKSLMVDSEKGEV